MAVPTNADEFYAKRDHRTNAYTGVSPAFAAKTVLVTADEAALRTYTGQLIASLSANLLSRWCRRVRLALPDIDLHPLLGTGSLLARILNQMRDADPFGEFAAVTSAVPSDLRLHIGEQVQPGDIGSAATTVLSCSNWFAAVRRHGDRGFQFSADDLNPIGAACAAVLGGAQAFRDALSLGDLYPAGFIFDGFAGMPAPAVVRRAAFARGLDVGNVLMVGAGAVGSATAFFMDLFGLVAGLTVVDADDLKVENLGRTPLFGTSGCGMKKASALADALMDSSVQVVPVPSWWHELDAQELRSFDLVIPVANEHDVRAHIQHALPPLMIHASTGSNWFVNFGRHIPGRDDCLIERFAGLEAQPQLACGGGSVPTAEGASVDASLPFLSFWAGLLVATDLVRLGVQGYPHTPNFGMYSFRRNRFTPQLLPRLARRDCDCRTKGPVFAKLRSDGRYRSLSSESW